MSQRPKVFLFAYGTLQQDAVQLATFGRLLEGRPDTLSGYRLEPLTITDPEVVHLSRKAVHHIACRSGNPTDRIAGAIFEIAEDELAASDGYEVDAYQRAEVVLDSGVRAFAYLGPHL